MTIAMDRDWLRRIAGVSVLFACSQIGAQTVPVKSIPPDLECPRCRIVAEKVGTITQGIEAADRVFNGEAVMDRFGRIYLVSDWRRWVVGVFDSTGRPLKTAGRQGAGPGEYQEIYGLLIGRGDSLHVFDISNGRRSILSPKTFAATRTQKWTAGYAAELNWLSAGRLVGTNRAYSTSPSARAIHVLDDAGQRVLMFDAGPDSTRGRLWGEGWRSITPDGRGGVFAAHNSMYQVDHWSARGKLTESWRRDVSWFDGNPEAEPHRSFEKGSNSYVSRIDRDPEGLIWIMIMVRDPRWKKALAMKAVEGGKEMLYPDDNNMYNDTVVEVFNPKTGRIVSSQRFDPMFTKMIRPGYTMSVSDDPEPTATIWRLRLLRE